MKPSMLDILACPMDRHHPLELYICAESNGEINEGALYCTDCSRFYPIIEKIPILLSDSLRDTKLDTDFLARNCDTLPEKITSKLTQSA